MYEKVCRSCGTRLSEFYNTGMLGCPDCYKSFGQEILVAIKNMQGATAHVGKKPRISNIDRELLKEYQVLLEAKEKAVLEERFTVVAELTRELHELQRELKDRGLI